MLRKMNSAATKAVMATVLGGVALSPSAAFAARILESQGTYVGTATNIWIVALKAILFFVGLGAILFSGWHLLKDYVLAKSDHEKSFSVGKLLVGCVVGSILCYPGGAAIIGGDITGTGADAATVNQSDFSRS